ATKAPAKKA
nr:Chain D, Synthetic peptide ATKAPAKKA [Mycobacterium tuberculosis H37Rv]6B0U_E Chain E, Synthetic peptide ATKAPAKKA [Mycobacterium tuberculosis H37Rv]